MHHTGPEFRQFISPALADFPAGLPLHEETFRVRGYEVGPEGTAPPQVVCDYLQEAAGVHAARLGLSLAALHGQGLAWVLARLVVEVARPPAEGETVTVRTWPCGVERLQYRRDYLALGGNGDVVARGASFWVVINLATRRPERMPPVVAGLLPDNPPLALAAGDRRLPAAPEGAQPCSVLPFTVRRADMDRNAHVNNVRYLDWALEGVPDHVRAAARPVRLDMHFRAETVFGDVVDAQCLPASAGAATNGCADAEPAGRAACAPACAPACNPDCTGMAEGGHCPAARFVHVLARRSDGREVARGVTCWR